MLPQGEVFTPTDTVPVLLNTTDPGTGEALAWTSGTIRLMRLRGDPATTTNWTEVTDDVGYSLTLDWDPSASPRTGLHVAHVDLDGLTSAALAGDLYVVVGSGGTVSTENMINLALAYFWVQSDGLTTPQQNDVNTAADTALADFFANLDEAALQQIVDDLEEGGRLDLLVDAIKAKTDSLTFTVTNVVDAHIQYVAGEAVDGAGTEDDPWGPA